MFMLLLCIYVCKYIYLCVSVYTCFIVQNMYHCSLPVRLSIRAVVFEFYLNFKSPQIIISLYFWKRKKNVKHVICILHPCLPQLTEVAEVSHRPFQDEHFIKCTPCSCLLCVYT